MTCSCKCCSTVLWASLNRLWSIHQDTVRFSYLTVGNSNAKAQIGGANARWPRRRLRLRHHDYNSWTRLLFSSVIYSPRLDSWIFHRNFTLRLQRKKKGRPRDIVPALYSRIQAQWEKLSSSFLPPGDDTAQPENRVCQQRLQFVAL